MPCPNYPAEYWGRTDTHTQGSLSAFKKFTIQFIFNVVHFPILLSSDQLHLPAALNLVSFTKIEQHEIFLTN